MEVVACQRHQYFQHLPTQLKQQRTKQRTSRETAAIAKPLHALLQQPHSFNEMTCKMQDILELQ